MIIGVTGTLGAGKGAVVEYLKTKGFTHYSARDFWNEEIARRGLVSNRDTMTEVANDLRSVHGADHFARTALERAQASGKDAVIESIRSVGEAEYLESHGAWIWAVNADIHTRYDRITKRASETDQVSFEKFHSDEVREMANDDPTKQNIQQVIESADWVFINDGSFEDLHAQIEEALAKTKKSGTKK